LTVFPLENSGKTGISAVSPILVGGFDPPPFPK
jgi:hypothetical protein